MGCNQAKNQIIYNRYESLPDANLPQSFSGPFVRTTKEDFEEAVKYYKDKTYISEVLKSFDTYKDKPCLGWRKEKDSGLEAEYSYINYGVVKSYAQTLAKNLIENDLHNTDEFNGYKFLGIFAKNCAEWIITDIACQLMSITTVTFYSTLGDLAFEHICHQTNVKTICVSVDSINTFINYKNKFGLENVQNVIVFDLSNTIHFDALDNLAKTGVKVFSFTNLVKNASPNDHPFDVSKPDTTLTLCYTSGTTALPKGAELTQRNFIAQMVNIDDAGYHINTKSTHFSYLPLAHVMERVCLLLAFVKGAAIGFISGDVRKYLREDMQILKPTFLVAVPRVLDTFRKLIFDELSKVPAGCKKNLVEKALRTKRENLISDGQITHSLFDKLVFNKIREKFGGKIEVFITGSAPLSKDLADDIKILFSVPIIEAYGMTESTAAAICTNVNDLSNTSAGGCISTFKIKLSDVPEMNYNSNTKLDGEASPTGEIMMKGPCIFKGYYKNPEETANLLNATKK